MALFSRISVCMLALLFVPAATWAQDQRGFAGGSRGASNHPNGHRGGFHPESTDLPGRQRGKFAAAPDSRQALVPAQTPEELPLQPESSVVIGMKGVWAAGLSRTVGVAATVPALRIGWETMLDCVLCLPWLHIPVSETSTGPA